MINVSNISAFSSFNVSLLLYVGKSFSLFISSRKKRMLFQRDWMRNYLEMPSRFISTGKSFAGRRKRIFFQYPSCISKTESWSEHLKQKRLQQIFFRILLNKFDSDLVINVQIVVSRLIWNRLNLNLTLSNVPPMVFSWDFDFWSLLVFAEPSLSVCDFNSRRFNIDWWTNIVIKNTQTDCACNLLIEWARSLHDVT